jgi:NAD(P)H-hydrate epimerase
MLMAGNPGMATGGTGDVLAGLIGGLLAQGLAAYDAARLGVWLHATAGDHAAWHRGRPVLTATDLLKML